jgi:hypothetical protein
MMLACLSITLCQPLVLSVRSYQCPADLNQLSNLLVRDLASYANRSAQRRRRKLDPYYNSYVVIGRNDVRPSLLDNPEYTPSQAVPQQLFLTSLERQYSPKSRSTEIQRFHWLFLSRSSAGWSLGSMYSRVGSSNSDPLLLPPTETSQTPFGEAVNTWIRDCNAGQIRPE